MEITILFNLIGISILTSGAFIAARGFFMEKDKDLMARTELCFGNNEHFESMLNQKYSEIVGFCLIIIGSLIQFIIMCADLNCTLQLNKLILLLIVITGAFILNFATIKFINLIITRRSDKVIINLWIKNYEISFPHIDKDIKKKNSCDHSLEMITKIIKRRYRKFNITEPKLIIEFAKNKYKE